LRRVYKIRRWRCILTFLGILTILLRSFLGCTLLPMPKFLGLRWKREFSFSFLGAFLEAVVAAGAAGFFGCIHIQMIACQQKTKQHTALPSTHCHSTAIARPSLNEHIIKCSTVQIDTRVRVYAIPCITHVQPAMYVPQLHTMTAACCQYLRQRRERFCDSDGPQLLRHCPMAHAMSQLYAHSSSVHICVVYFLPLCRQQRSPSCVCRHEPMKYCIWVPKTAPNRGTSGVGCTEPVYSAAAQLSAPCYSHSPSFPRAALGNGICPTIARITRRQSCSRA